MKNKETTSKSNKIKIILIVTLFICFICAISYLIYTSYSSYKNKALYGDLQGKEENIIPDEVTNELSKVNNEFMNKVKELKQENADVKGWIHIEDTKINYPLLQTNNNDYYLKHNYKKQESSYGSIYINSNCDLENINANVIIYGHDMKDGQMFKDLLKYQDKNFYEQHPTIKIATEDEEIEYEIVCAFRSRIFYQDEKNVFRYYQHYNFENEEQYNEYINNCKKIQLYDTGKTANYGEQIITLITCEYSQENGRMVVIAKKI